MVNVFLISALLLGCVAAHAQLTVLVQEDFKDNHLGWHEEKDDKHSVQIKNGHYEIIAPAGGWMTYIYPGLDERKDFLFEASFTQTNGSTDNGFGFIWGYDEKSKINAFVISTNGYAKVWTYDEARKDAKDWKKIENIKPLGLANRLKVEQRDEVMKFFVNGAEVFSIKPTSWYGKTLGFVAYTDMRLLVDDFILKSDIVINLPADMPRGLVKENLGAMVNTEFDEVTPKISVDGRTIYFARKHSPANTGGEQDASDIWFSTSVDGVTWTTSKNIGAPINSEQVNNIVSIGQDNNSILMATATDFELFERTTSGWRSAGMLGVQYQNEHKYFEASQAPDGKSILFTAKNKSSLFYKENREEKDVFVSLKGVDGKWSTPINLGPVINTPGNEASPVLAADGRTLYFASDGHPGYGGLDIFMSKRIGDSWTSWTKPVNLGPEINTFGFDAYYTVPASGEVAYLCTSAGGFGKSDIVRIKLPQSVKPDPVVLVFGKVLNAKTNKPVQAEIIFENIVTRKEAGEAKSDPATGDYRVVLPYGTNYGLHARAKGFLSVNENLELMSVSTYTESKKDLLLVPIEVGEAIALNNVFFEQGKPVLKPESYPELDRLVIILKENPTMEIMLSGHTDNVGNPTSLLALSQARVGAVKDYLVKNGIAAGRITGKGYGSEKPLVKNDTEENRKMNRRVEFKVTRK
ncbi:MAG: OmpA family protein [Cyclobacteriaceae bacterium]|nr:OmpA family protein [Cyclobacteriaceae bacterium]UYN87348.1 MAG: OmpA family protein [Cyclobacteriaceae bacterium]